MRRMVEPPTSRRLCILAFDPSLATQLETTTINEITAEVDWERLELGPDRRVLRGRGLRSRPATCSTDRWISTTHTCSRRTACCLRSPIRSSTSRWSTRSP